MSSLIPPKYVQPTLIIPYTSDKTDPDFIKAIRIKFLSNQVGINQLVITGVYIGFKVLVTTAFNAVLFSHILNHLMSLLCKMTIQSLITVALLSLSSLGICFLQHTSVLEIY